MPGIRQFLNIKLHGVTITGANLDYEGSLQIPEDILKETGILPNEQVHVWNVTKGTRLQTYAICGPAGSKEFHINGAAAHLASPGDKVIVATFTGLTAEQAADHNPLIFFFSPQNDVVEQRKERVAGK